MRYWHEHSRADRHDENILDCKYRRGSDSFAQWAYRWWMRTIMNILSIEMNAVNAVPTEPPNNRMSTIQHGIFLIRCDFMFIYFLKKVWRTDIVQYKKKLR